MIQLIRSNRRTISLVIEDDGSLLVRAPNHTRIEYVEKFLQEKEDWVQKHRKLMESFLRRKNSCKFINSRGILFLGQRTKPSGVSLDRYQSIKSWYKLQGKKYVEKRLDFFARKFDLQYRNCKITEAKRRWGSCSARNDLNFSWRLMMAPKKVIDYVIIHELAHIRHKNHSQKFWDLVKSMMKDYEEYDQWLEDNRFLLGF